MSPRVLILRAPGTNCEGETAFAFERAGARAEVVHLGRLLENAKLAADYHVLCIPGGFSYGDDISAGRIFGTQMRQHLGDALRQFKDAGKLILGICNGFQILIKSGVLLPDRPDEPLATLTLNESGKFEDRWVHLRVAGPKCVFLQGIERMYLPVAHAEGKFVARDQATLQRLDQSGQLVLRYAVEPQVSRSKFQVSGSNETCNLEPETRNSLVPYPACPNGAQLCVAGMCDETGRVFGLMPHPERHIAPTQHPRWTRERRASGDGLAVFENAVRFFA
jgi:phosphoribosylformylglycinamidine synthase